MGSEDRQVREKQFEKAKSTFDARKALLVEKGLDEKVQAKDAVLKNLKAGVKKARERIAAMTAAEAHVQEMAKKNTKAKKDKKKSKGGGAQKKQKPQKK